MGPSKLRQANFTSLIIDIIIVNTRKMDTFKDPKRRISIKLWFVKTTILFFAFFLIKLKEIKNLPKEGPFIVAANHLSHVDPLLVSAYVIHATKRYLHFFAALKYRWNPLFRFLVEVTESIWADSKSGRQSMLVALEYLKHGANVGILPEGTRSPDGKIKKGKNGVAALALTSKVPLVPIGIINTHKVLPRGGWHLHPTRGEVILGKPMKFDAYYQAYDKALDQDDKERLNEVEESVLREIMREIAKLSRQEYPY